MNQDDDTNQEIGDDEWEHTGESTLPADIQEDDLDDHQKVLLLGQVDWDKLL